MLISLRRILQKVKYGGTGNLALNDAQIRSAPYPSPLRGGGDIQMRLQTYGPDRGDRVRRRHGRPRAAAAATTTTAAPSGGGDADGDARASTCRRIRRSQRRSRRTSRSSGELTVAADATYPPDEFIASDGKTVIGMDADLAKAHRQIMGLTGRASRTAPSTASSRGSAAGKYDLGMSSFTDTKEREQTVDFVTYAQAGTSFYRQRRRRADHQLARRALRPQGRRRRRARRSRPTTRRRRARSARTRASRRQAGLLRTRTASTWRSRAGAPTSRMADSPVADVHRQAVGRPVQARPGALRTRPLRDRDAEGQRPAPARARCRQGADGRRHIQKILDYWGLRSAAISNPTSTERSS